MRFRACLAGATLWVWLVQAAAAGAIPDEVLVKYRRETGTIPAWASTRHYIGYGVYAFRVSAAARGETGNAQRMRLRKRVATLRANPNVEFAEPNGHGRFGAMPAAADDKARTRYWWLDALDARQAWAIATGSSITVAVIDSGVDFAHPALRGRLRPDDYNFGDCTPECASGADTRPQDKLGHGTFVAGFVAAQPAAGSDYSGLAPDAMILPIKINPGMMDDFTAATLAQANDYARLHGARVINLSTDMPQAASGERQVVTAALRRAMDAGVLIVAAAGNRAGAVTFPGNYPGVIAVAGIDENGAPYRRSNVGPEIAIAAPAENLQSTRLGGGLGRCGSGTSFAAPLVAATLADMLQAAPGLTAAEARRILAATATPARDGFPSHYAALNAGKALQSLANR